MKTNKLLALITVVCLLVCAAIPAFAAPGDRVYPEYNEELMGYELVCDGSTNIITVPAGDMPNLSVTAGSTVSCYAMDTEGNNGEYTVYFGRSPMDTVVAEEGNASAVFATGMGCVYNYSEVELTFYITVTEPAGGDQPAGPALGSIDNPIILTELGEYTATAIETTNHMGMTYGEPSHYKWIADTTGLLVLTVDKNSETGWSYTVNNVTTGSYGNLMTSDSDYHVYLQPVTEGDEIVFNVGTAWNNIGESITFALSMVAEPDGTFNSAMDLNAAQVTVPAGSSAIYTINSMLNGMTLTVEGGEYTLNNYYNGTELNNDPVNILMLTNNTEADVVYTLSAGYPLGTEGNPISVNVPGDLTVANIPFLEEVWYAFSSRLHGAVLTVTGEGAYVIVNGTRVDAVDGVVTVDLVAEGAVIPVVIGNSSWEDAAYACTIEMPPVEITAEGAFAAQIAPGAEVQYLINSRLAGYTLTVTGEGAYVVMGETKYEAVDGVVTVVLESAGPVIPVVIGNASETAAAYECEITYVDVPAPTGDLIFVAVALALTSGSALVCLKKKEN